MIDIRSAPANTPRGQGEGAAPVEPGPGSDVYGLLSWIFPRSYRAKLLSVVLAGTLLPMLVLVVWLLANNGADPDRLILGSALGLAATFAGTCVSLLLLYRLLQPVRRAVQALEAYETGKILPERWSGAPGNDEVARLMAGIHRCLHAVDASRRQLERHALEDALTLAMNRRGTRQALRASVQASAATGDPFVLVVVDLDNLKAINDERGHAAGDYALVSLVASARECCLGAGDWVGRWGGDEFMLGLHAEPGIAIDRIKAWIDVMARPGGDGVPIHVSAGAAPMQPGLEPADLYRRADAAMYRAKFAGGRRLLQHEEQAPCNAANDAA